MFDGDLAGNDGRGATMAIIKDLQKVAPFGRIENRKAPVVEDQELKAADGFEQAAISASPRARASASNRRGTRWYWTERLSRQALWPRAQAIQLLPSPVAPVMSSFSLRSIHSPLPTLAKTARSIPPGVPKPTSSTPPLCPTPPHSHRHL